MRKSIGTLLILAMFVAGCDQKDDSVAKKTGEKIGKAATDFAAGVGKGVDKTLSVETEAAPGLTAVGMSKTVGKLDASHDGKLISVYIIASKPIKTRLVAHAINKEGQEVGRCIADVEFAADEARYVNFALPKEMDSQLVAKYIIDAQALPATTQAVDVMINSPQAPADPPAP